MRIGNCGLSSLLDDACEERDVLEYCAPERLKGKREEKSDVWSLGIVLIELVERSNPYASTSLKRMRAHICNEDPPSLSRKKWSPALVDFVNKCLVKSVKKRASVRELMGVSDCEWVQA